MKKSTAPFQDVASPEVRAMAQDLDKAGRKVKARKTVRQAVEAGRVHGTGSFTKHTRPAKP